MCMNLSYNIDMRASFIHDIAFDFLMRDASILWQHSKNSYRNNVSSSYKKKIELFFKVVLFLFFRVDGKKWKKWPLIMTEEFLFIFISQALLIKEMWQLYFLLYFSFQMSTYSIQYLDFVVWDNFKWTSS